MESARSLPPKRFRLTGKTAPQEAEAKGILARTRSASPSLPARGLYDVLRIGRAAALSVVRRAYRKRALEVHPDKKGGDTDAFRAVLEAFETLADEARRSVYDLGLRSSGSQDGHGWSDDVPGQRVSHTSSQAADAASSVDVEKLAALRKTFAVMYKSAASEDDILELSAYELLILQHLLRKERPPWLQGPSSSAADATGTCETNFKYLRSYKYSGYMAYRVELHHCNIHITTQQTRCLEQAIDWQIALICMRDKAKHRFARRVVESGDAVDGDDPLIEEELFDALCEQPSMTLMFVHNRPASAKRPAVRVATGSLRLAMSLWRSIRAGKHISAEEKESANQAFTDHCSKLLDMVDERLVSRVRALSAASDAARADEVNVHAAKSLQLALKWDAESARQAAYKLNALSAEELERRKEWLLAPAPCSSIFNGLLAISNETLGGKQKRRRVSQQQQSRASFQSAGKSYRPRPQDPPWNLGVQSEIPERQVRRPEFAMSSIGGVPSEAFCLVLSWLTLRELDCVNAASIAMKYARCTEIWKSLRAFTFVEREMFPLPVSFHGRTIKPPKYEDRLALRLSEFLTKYSQAFEVLDLRAVPCAILQRPQILEAMAQIPHVEHAILPLTGWTTPSSRTNVLQSLGEGVRFEFVHEHGNTRQGRQ